MAKLIDEALAQSQDQPSTPSDSLAHKAVPTL